MEMQTARSLLQVHGIGSEPAHRLGVLASAFSTLKSAARVIARWRRQRRDIMELQRMDDRLLADIGITRGEAESMVRHGRWGQGSFEPDAAFPATDRKRSPVLIWDKELGERA